MDADTTVLQRVSQHTQTLARVDPAGVDLRSLEHDVVVTGSPRLNPLAERIQQLFDPPCQYVSARAAGDADARDESAVLAPDRRTLRIVTSDGDELAASADNAPGRNRDGIDYGSIVLVSFDSGRRLVWLSGIHEEGTLGAYEAFADHADRLIHALPASPAAPVTVFTQLVRVKYRGRSAENTTGDIDAEPFGDCILSTPSPAAPRRRGVLFDLGDVVVRFDRNRTYRAIGYLVGRDYLEVRAAIEEEDHRTRFIASYGIGALSTDDFCDRLATLFGAEDRLREWIPSAWGDIFWPNYEMFEVLRFLKVRTIPLGIVSDTNPLHFEHLERLYPDVMRLFDTRSLSFAVKAMKVQPALFNDAIDKMRRMGVQSGDLLYVDDLDRHVAAMRALGIEGFVYRSHSHFVFWLRKHGVYVPTSFRASPDELS